MSVATINREDAVPAVTTVPSLSPNVAAETVRPARRRSSPRMASATGSGQPPGDRSSEPRYPSGRILADMQMGVVRIYRHALSRVQRALHWLQERRQWQLASKRLVLCETVSLGEKRFVAIVKVDGQQFLLGGAAGTVSMLSRLHEPDKFADILQRRQTGRAVQ